MQWFYSSNKNYISSHYTAQKMKISIKDFFIKCDQIRNCGFFVQYAFTHSVCNILEPHDIWYIKVKKTLIYFRMNKNSLKKFQIFFALHLFFYKQ